MLTIGFVCLPFKQKNMFRVWYKKQNSPCLLVIVPALTCNLDVPCVLGRAPGKQEALLSEYYCQLLLLSLLSS
jgi:hypothetical protein